MASLRLLAAAKSLSKIKQAEKEKEEERLKNLISSLIPSPVKGVDGVNGRDGKDAPSLEEIIAALKPHIPSKETVVVREIEKEKQPSLSKEGLAQILAENELKLEDKLKSSSEHMQALISSLEGNGEFITKKELSDFAKKVDKAIASAAGGGGGWQNSFTTLDERVDQLVSDLTSLLTDISTNTSSLASLEAFFERVLNAVQANKKQLELLNLRTEEAYDTKINIEDIN